MASRYVDRLVAIDDEAGLLSIVGEAALGVGYDVQTTTAAAAFLELIHDWEPTLILMDLQMPEVDGVELLRRLAAAHVGVPIVLTQAQFAAVARRGCGMGQGYLFARPQPADAIR